MASDRTSYPSDRDAHALAACWCGRDHLAEALPDCGAWERQTDRAGYLAAARQHTRKQEP